MKLFVRVLLQRPAPDYDAEDKLKQSIKALPSHLKASGFHKAPSKTTGQVKPGYLCDLHKGIKKGLCYEIMSLIMNEISHIGKFIYPVIMSGKLEAQWEHRIRQLEPVPAMYIAGFTERDCTPDGHEPIWPGSVNEKGEFVPLWHWQVSQCPACMLARIGSERMVLFALLTGMVARISRRRRGAKDNLKSRRVRFVKEWLQASHEDGRAFVNDAFAVGQDVRAIRREQRLAEYVAKKRALNGSTVHADGSDAAYHQPPSSRSHGTDPFDVDPETASLCRPGVDTLREDQASSLRHDSPASSVIGMDISDSYAPAYQQASTQPSPYMYSAAKQEADSVVDFDISEPFVPGSPALRQSVVAGGTSLPRKYTEGTRRGSNGSTVIGVDISEPFLPAPPMTPRKAPPRPATPARPRTVQEKRATLTNSKHYSIASSFASDVSLSNIRPPTNQFTELLPQALRIRAPEVSKHSLPSISGQRMERQGGRQIPPPLRSLPRPHPNSIYGTYGRSEKNTPSTAYVFADVSPPTTPMGYGDPVGQFDVSPLASPEQDAFGVSPPATPARPATAGRGFF